ncbi:MAG: hypothetical protein ACTJHT_15535 [Sphingobacterium sp.]
MKREELDRQKAKYWGGKTSLEEERKLKELEGEKFFNALQPSEEAMDWDFDDFIQQVNEKKPEIKKVRPLARHIIPMTTIAATVIFAFFLIRQIIESNSDTAKPIITRAEVNSQVLDLKKSGTKNKGLTDQDDTPRIANSPLSPTDVKQTSIANNKKDHMKSTEDFKVGSAREEFYVEINGVKIYNQEKAIEITETALQLATSNLKKGMKGVKNIKYLKIEI